MERQSQIRATIITTLTFLLAGTALIIWLRGVDLPSPVKFRMLAALLVVVAGSVGSVAGRWSGRGMQPQKRHYLVQRLSVAGFWMIALVLDANFALAFWRVSAKTPMPYQQLTGILSNLLFFVFFTFFLGMLAWELLSGKKDDAAVE
ncbi:MAG TPA: hypothetical protein VGM23_18190 [Armatimonadota bacterium]|jgi:hypothetical protein